MAKYQLIFFSLSKRGQLKNNKCRSVLFKNNYLLIWICKIHEYLELSVENVSYI